MKIIKRVYNPVTVNYFDIFLPVPPGVNWIATDQDGGLYGYAIKPIVSSKSFWNARDAAEFPVELGRVDLQGADWRESLREVQQ